MSATDELAHALDAARARVGALVTERVRALEEARRLRGRAGAAPDLAGLEEVAVAYEAQAAALAEAIESARGTAHEAELALERVRAREGTGRGGASPGPGGGAPRAAPDSERGPADGPGA